MMENIKDVLERLAAGSSGFLPIHDGRLIVINTNSIFASHMLLFASFCVSLLILLFIFLGKNCLVHCAGGTGRTGFSDVLAL